MPSIVPLKEQHPYWHHYQRRLISVGKNNKEKNMCHLGKEILAFRRRDASIYDKFA